MKFRGLDGDGDWLLGSGLGSYAQDQAAIALDIAARLRLRKGEVFFAPQAGVDYTNLLQKGQEKNLIAAQQNCVLQTPGVVKIITFPTSFNPTTRASSVGPATVQTIFGQVFLAQLSNLAGGLVNA